MEITQKTPNKKRGTQKTQRDKYDITTKSHKCDITTKSHEGDTNTNWHEGHNTTNEGDKTKSHEHVIIRKNSAEALPFSKQ
jgi:hypothetical protein